jgi:hypothetical protein
VHEDGRRLQQLFEEVMLAHDDLLICSSRARVTL